MAAPQYTLGKDATITGLTNTNIRDVKVSVEGKKIDKTARGATSRKSVIGMKDVSIEVEMVDAPPAINTVVTITHANSGMSGTYWVTNVQRKEPLSDIVSFAVTLKRKTAPVAGP